MVANIKAPDSSIVHQTEELTRSISTDTLFDHVMRCYWFGELYAQREGIRIDSEQLFLSAVFHDLGLTDHARGPHRFEIESAHAARSFLVEGRRYPRLNFNVRFYELLEHDLDSKQPYPHVFHPCSRIAHDRSPVAIDDRSTLQQNGPFAE